MKRDDEQPKEQPVTKEQLQDLCRECHRKPEAVNNQHHECSHVDCPHRGRVPVMQGYDQHKVPRHGLDPNRKHLIEDGWGSGCYKKRATFEE